MVQSQNRRVHEFRNVYTGEECAKWRMPVEDSGKANCGRLDTGVKGLNKGRSDQIGKPAMQETTAFTIPATPLLAPLVLLESDEIKSNIRNILAAAPGCVWAIPFKIAPRTIIRICSCNIFLESHFRVALGPFCRYSSFQCRMVQRFVQTDGGGTPPNQPALTRINILTGKVVSHNTTQNYYHLHESFI